MIGTSHGLVLALLIRAVMGTEKADVNYSSWSVGFANHDRLNTEFSAMTDTAVKRIVVFCPTSYVAEAFPSVRFDKIVSENVVSVADKGMFWSYHEALPNRRRIKYSENCIFGLLLRKEHIVDPVDKVLRGNIAAISLNRVKSPSNSITKASVEYRSDIHFFEIDVRPLSNVRGANLPIRNPNLSIHQIGLPFHQLTLLVSDAGLPTENPGLKKQNAKSSPFVRMPWLWSVVCGGIPIAFYELLTWMDRQRNRNKKGNQ